MSCKKIQTFTGPTISCSLWIVKFAETEPGITTGFLSKIILSNLIEFELLSQFSHDIESASKR